MLRGPTSPSSANSYFTTQISKPPRCVEVESALQRPGPGKACFAELKCRPLAGLDTTPCFVTPPTSCMIASS